MTESTRIGRERLPNRRPSLTVRTESIGHSYHVTIGLSDDGRVLELFARAAGKHDSDQDRLVDDLAVLISRLLQHGDNLASIAAGLGKLAGEPSSPAGVIVMAALKVEQELDA